MNPARNRTFLSGQKWSISEPMGIRQNVQNSFLPKVAENNAIAPFPPR